MKLKLHILRVCQCTILGLLLAPATPTRAQSAPGWGWAKTFGGATVTTNEDSRVTAIQHDAADNLYVLGNFVGDNSFSASNYVVSAGESDVFLAKYTPAGALLWAQTLSSTGVDKAATLTVTLAGDCLITGTYGGLSGGDLTLPSGTTLQGPQGYGAPTGSGNYGRFPFVARFSAQGVLQWATRFMPSYDACVGTQVDSQGNVFLYATATGPLTIGGQTYPLIGRSDAFIIKMNAARQVQWVWQSGQPGMDTVGGLTLDTVDNMYWSLANNLGAAITVDGQSFSPPGIYQSVLVKISKQNRVRWGYSSAAFVTWVGMYPGNNIEILGFDKASCTFLFQTLRAANHTASFRGANFTITTPAGGNSSVVGRIDTSGNVISACIWSQSTSAATYVPDIKNLHFNAQGQVTVMGMLRDDFSVMGSPDVFTGSGNIFVTRFNLTTRTSPWTRVAQIDRYPIVGFEKIFTSSMDSQGNVYVAGNIINPAQFGAFTLTPSRNGYRSDGFVAKLDMTVLATKAATLGRAWAVYPNPATGAVQLSGLPPLATVQVLDGQGRRVREVQTSATTGAEQRLPLTGLAVGLYTLLVMGTDEAYRPQRLTVE